MQSFELLGFLQLNQQQIHENIKFADQKAGVVIVLNTALLGGLYQVAKELCPLWLLASACLLIATGGGLAFLVLWPRGRQNKQRGGGVVDAIRISRLTHAEYLDRAARVSIDDLIRETWDFVFDRACIDHRKYQLFRLSLAVSGIGWLLSGALVWSTLL